MSRSEAAIVQTKSLPRQLLLVQRSRSPSTQFLYWLKSSSTMFRFLYASPYPAAPGLRVAFCPGEERRMAPLAGEVHMDAFLRLPFVLDEAWED